MTAQSHLYVDFYFQPLPICTIRDIGCESKRAPEIFVGLFSFYVVEGLCSNYDESCSKRTGDQGKRRSIMNDIHCPTVQTVSLCLHLIYLSLLFPRSYFVLHVKGRGLITRKPQGLFIPLARL